ncbi:MAG: hypothetical protein N2490_03930 [Ignavibacteria bacterium]|nr:hypothetical protein [Ignavibacteria bacterium]
MKTKKSIFENILNEIDTKVELKNSHTLIINIVDIDGLHRANLLPLTRKIYKSGTSSVTKISKNFN